MNKTVTELPGGMKVAITMYRDGETEVETINSTGMNWHLWFDKAEQIPYFADVLNDFIDEHNLRKEAHNDKE